MDGNALLTNSLTVMCILGVLFGVTIPSAFALIQDLSCPSCVTIPEGEIDLYKSLFPLIIWTDDTVYDHNSIVSVNGFLRPGLEFNPVTILVTNPIGNVVAVEQLNPDSDGNFALTINTSGKLWSQDGNYIIKAQSGPERVFKTRINLVSYDLGTKSTCQINEITLKSDNGGIYCIQYQTTAEITGIDGTISTSQKTISLDVRGKSIDTLNLVLPRYIIDSKADNVDTEFVVMYNGKLTSYKEIETTPDYRIISVTVLPDRQGKIDIIGTSIVPEFGMVTALILGISIMTMIIVSKKRTFIFLK